MVVVYIASPYAKGDQATNVKRQIDTAHILMDKGFCPIAPLLSHFLQMARPRGEEEWMQIDFEIVRRVDVLLRLPGDSSGADREVALAKELGIPVVGSIGELLDKVSPQERV